MVPRAYQKKLAGYTPGRQSETVGEFPHPTTNESAFGIVKRNWEIPAWVGLVPVLVGLLGSCTN